MTNETQGGRVDKWLWAARFYKTRQLAVKAIKNSQVALGKNTIKPATNIRIGDVLSLKRGLYQLEIEVLALSDKRGSATIAQGLYRETQNSITARENLRRQLVSQPKVDIEQRKPDKRGVRSHRALKRGE